MNLTACRFFDREIGQGKSFTLTFDLNASDAIWAGEKMLRVAKRGYVKNPVSSAVQQGQGQSQNPMRKGYVFTGWYTEANEAKQTEARRFKFKDEKRVTPNSSSATNAASAASAPSTLKRDITLYAGWAPLTLEGVVKLGKLPSDLSLYDEFTRTVLGPYKAEAAAGASVSAVFVTVKGGSVANKRDGKSWETAWAGSQLRKKLDGINNASASKVYLFLVAAGEYRKGAREKTSRYIIPIFEGSYSREGWLAMKDEVAIVGGWDGTGGGGSWKRGPNDVTNFIGDKAADEAQGEGYSVFYNKNLKNKATLAYATVSDGRARVGAGMYNTHSSPVLMSVTFSGNSGGGMLNSNSSPVLTNVTFSGNSASGSGGGMTNFDSSPVLTNVTFSGNSASGSGGGMYNVDSSPVLMNVTFTGNSADGGGGMYNFDSSPVLMNVTFTGNLASAGGGGMYNNNGGGKGPTVVNSIFWGNTVKGQTQGSQIYLSNDEGLGSGSENISLYNCIVEGGVGLGLGLGIRAGVSSAASSSASASLPNPLTLAALSGFTDQTRFGGISVKYTDSPKGDPVSITYANVYGADKTQDPKLVALAQNGGSVQTIPIAEGSFAINKGLYLRRVGANVYYSDDNSNWFIHDVLTQRTPSALPSEAIDVTATDARGYRRVGRPDIGAYEYGGVAP